jgi:hypothetical protein
VEELLDDTNMVARPQLELEILLLLLKRCDDIDDWPWRPMEEVMDAIADPIAALEAMASLAEKGLIRRKDEFVMASSTAYGFYQLITEPPRAEWVRSTA